MEGGWGWGGGLVEGACPSHSAKKGDLAPLLQSVEDIQVICRQPAVAAAKHGSNRKDQKKKNQKLPTEGLYLRFKLRRKTLPTRAAILLKTFLITASGGGMVRAYFRTLQQK